MKKIKFLTAFLIVIAIILVVPNISKAAESNDNINNSGVKYTRVIPSNEGTIKLNFTGLELDEKKAYEFALVRQGGTPENWFAIDDGYSTTTASITLNSATSKIGDVLRATDKGFIYIREKNSATESYIIEAYKVDLKLPYLQSLDYKKYDKAFSGIVYEWYRIYGGFLNSSYYQWQKVTDRELIEKFLEIKNNAQEITELEVSLPTPPITGYNKGSFVNCEEQDDGLYLLWVKRTEENCKEIYSCIVHDGLPEATKVEQYIKGLDVEKPTVESIKVISPESGTYKTSQTIKITVTFSEEITATTIPTLKIKFGESEEREVTNGIINGKTIVYSYNIVEGDKGQLAVTSYTGGTIKDASGNEAILSCPVITGNTIKANVEGTNTNNTPNQDTTNNDNKPNDDNNPPADDGNKPADTTTKPDTSKKEDNTTATGKLPQTGLSMGISLAIMVVLAGCVFAYLKYNKLGDI